MDDQTIRESAKAARAVAKTTGKVVDAGRYVGRWFNTVFGRAIVNTVDLYWTDRMVAKRIEAAIYDWKRLQELFANADADLKWKGLKPTKALAPKIAIPLIEHATMENERSLRVLWGRLLASGVSKGEEINRTYVTVLGELTAADAKVLKSMFEEWQTLSEKKEKWDGHVVSYQSGIERENAPPDTFVKFNRLGLVRPAWVGLMIYDPEGENEYGFLSRQTRRSSCPG
jgi:hypothetical protein